MLERVALDVRDADTLVQLARHSRLHVLVGGVESDADERRVRRVLGERGLYDAGLLAHRVLVCSTPAGKVAALRQLEPSLYIDADETAVCALEPHLPSVALVAPSSAHGTVRVRKARLVTSIADVFTD